MNSIKVLSLAFSHGKWSWGLTAKALYDRLQPEFTVIAKEVSDWAQNDVNTDIVLCQNVTVLRWIAKLNRADILKKTVMRLGGNMSFDDKQEALLFFRGMGQSHSVIATNNELYDLAKTVNVDSYMIPNGLDLNSWYCDVAKKRNKPLVVGFIGNVASIQHAGYKGYYLVRKACMDLGIELREALFQDAQIPHDQMREHFWNKIDLLILPTAGEGCSNTIMEALACGVPVITTRAAGFHGEVLEDGHNVIFCERSVESIKAAIKSLNVTVYNRLAMNGRLFAEKYHNIDWIADQYRIILRECYNDTTARSSDGPQN